ncbi:SRPBCC family protein [Hyphomicrobium sp. CS1GBMeth3]|uniref:SRPBCC family protein n=1 Tax=Hyphomicrobium sp. CS1GBMeth3 TaxID=1892845 RepID=UPI00093008F6|nr:SRPBCC family protein [Hyphomicrobium sp. CS1GBMeth3]
MKITKSFQVARPLPAVWALMQDIPTVAACMPGAELTEDKGDGAYAGRVGIKLGPFSASFEGEAKVTQNEADHSGRVEGRGLDKRGGSRSKLVLDYKVSEAGASTTQVDIDADVQLSGPITQFGRTGIITETAGILVEQFARNVEQRLEALPDTAPAAESQASTGKSNDISILRLIGLLIASLFRRRKPSLQD